MSPSSKTMLWYRDRSEAEEQMTTTTHGPVDTTSRHHRLRPQAAVRNESIETQDGRPSLLDTGAVNLSLVKATCLSHGAAFVCALVMLSMAMVLNTDTGAVVDFTSLHWNSNTGGISTALSTASFHSLLDWKMTPWRVIEGAFAAVPLIAMGTMVEHSEHRSASHIHVSVTNTVIALFGRRRKETEEQQSIATTTGPATTTSTLQVLFFSLGIAIVSAVSEELVFRGLLPVVLVSYTHSVGLALLGQALLFGMGQIRRKSSVAENGVFSLMQVMNGLWYGAVYLAAGGDIVPVLVAHILYECHIFVGAWKTINDQMDYTETASSKTLSAEDQRELEKIRKEAGGSLSTETFQFCRRFFYAFDSEHQGSLSLADVKRAVAYAFLQDEAQPSDEKAIEIFDQMMGRRRSRSPSPTSVGHEDGTTPEDRLSLPEFLRLLFALKSKSWKNQLA